jgi:hypothetical protein
VRSEPDNSWTVLLLFLSLTMLYNWRSHSSALFILLTSTTTPALYVPRSKITTTTTTTTTSKITFVWSDQHQQFDPSNEDTATLPFTCFRCPMKPKLIREIRMFAPDVEIGAPSNGPEPRALLCEYDTNESPCRYHPVCRAMSWSLVSSLTARHPTGYWHASPRPAIRRFLRSFGQCIS